MVKHLEQCRVGIGELRVEAFSSPTFSPHPIFSSLLGANLIIESCGWNVLVVSMGASFSLQTPCLRCSGVFIPVRIWLPSWRISSPLQAGGMMPPAPHVSHSRPLYKKPNPL